jgi:RHS repeat-associated protein
MQQYLRYTSCLVIFLCTALFCHETFAGNSPFIARHGINFSTGNKYLSEQDVNLIGPVASLHFSRHYNSQSMEAGVFGHGWSFSEHETLQVVDGQDLIVHARSDGHLLHFYSSDTDQWTSTVGEKAVVTRILEGYQLLLPDGRRKMFCQAGRLVNRQDSNGNQIFYTYDDDHLTTIADAFGRSLALEYDGEGRIRFLITPIGRFTYAYDTRQNLVSVTRPNGTQRLYLYEDPHNPHSLTGLIDANGTRIRTLAYDAMGRVISSALTDDQEKVTIAYQPGFKRVITDSLGAVSIYQLETRHGVARIQSFIGPGCSSCGGDSAAQYVYDFRQQVTQKTDARGVVTRYAYDEQGRRVSETRAAGTPLEYIVQTSYIAEHNKPVAISEPSVANPGQQKVTSMAYDVAGNLLTRTESGFNGTEAISRTINYQYDAHGRTTAINGPRTEVDDLLSFAYYENSPEQGANRGFLRSVTNGLGHTTTYSHYNGLGLPEQVEDANGLQTTLLYDDQGHVLSRTTGDRSVTYQYDPAGTLLAVTLPGSRIISFAYTPSGRIDQITDQSGNTIVYTYDNEGRVLSQSVHDPEQVLTTFLAAEYDQAGQLVNLNRAGGSTEKLAYDAVGNLVSWTRGQGKTTFYAFDALNRLTSLAEPGATMTGFTYDLHGNLTTVTDAKGNVTRYRYDDLGNRVKTDAPDTGKTRYTYDFAGNLIGKTDANSISVSYSYDLLNRIIGIRYADASLDVTYNYDEGVNGKGRLTGVRDGSGSVRLRYDQYGNLIEETVTRKEQSFFTSYRYNDNNELIAMTYPSGRVVSYHRDATGSVIHVTSTYQGQVTTIAENIASLPFGPITAMTLGNGLPVHSSFDLQYRLLTRQAGSVLNRAYTYNDLDQVTSIDDLLDSSRSQSFSYDDPGRLIRAEGIYGIINYVYDAVGNRLIETRDNTISVYQYAEDSNRLEQVQGLDTVAYRYDPAGNILAQGGQEYSWNEDNRLQVVTVDDVEVGRYGYDHRGLRVLTTTSDGTLVALYDPDGHLLVEADESSNVLREYVYLNHQRLALFDYTELPAFTVRVATTSGATPEGLPVYAFDAHDQYTGFAATTDSQGQARFHRDDFGQGPYRFRVDYLGHQVWTEPVVVRASRGIVLVIEKVVVDVQAVLNGATADGVPVYAFTSAGEYLGLFGMTDSDGRVRFDLPVGGHYMFQAELFAEQYASGPVTITPDSAVVTIDPGGGILKFQIFDDSGSALPGLTTSLYNEAGAFLGVSRIGDSQGEVNYTLAAGRYLVRVDYLGYPFWSDVLAVTADTEERFVLPHHEVRVRVGLKIAEAFLPLSTISCTLFTPEGQRLNVQGRTDDHGEMVFRVPERNYRVRGEYLGQEYWSADTTWQDVDVSIAAGQVKVLVMSHGEPLAGVPVHACSLGGVATGLSDETDDTGSVRFTLPAGGYRFLAMHADEQFWSGAVSVTADQLAGTTISTGGGSFVFSVGDNLGHVLEGVRTMLFSASGPYLNQSVHTSSTGEARYGLADGAYRLVAEYLGYEYATEPLNIPAVDRHTLTIPHGEQRILVQRSYLDALLPAVESRVTLTTFDGMPLPLDTLTNAAGLAHLVMPLRPYRLQAQYLGRFYSIEAIPGVDSIIHIPEGVARVVLRQAGVPLPGITVRAISDTAPGNPMFGTTNAGGDVTFRLPAGEYTFKAMADGIEYQGVGTVQVDTIREVVLDVGGSTLSLTVRGDGATVLVGLSCSLYDVGGVPLNRIVHTDENGIAAFTVGTGSYRIKVQYLEQDFWSEPISVPETLSASLHIAHQDLSIEVLTALNHEVITPLSGMRCYLYAVDESGATATGLYTDSDENGMVMFRVPVDRWYRGVVFFIGQEFVSDAGADGVEQRLTVELGTLTVSVTTMTDEPVSDAEVALFTIEGDPLNRTQSTDVFGEARFLVPEGWYRLRMRLDGEEYWSRVIFASTFEDTWVNFVNGWDEPLSRLHNPYAPLWHGTPPMYAPRLASAVDVSGILLAPPGPQIVPVHPRVAYFLNDHLNTTQILTDATGTVIWQGDFLPFGQVQEVVNLQNNRFRFPGQILDSESGLHYNWHRYYDPGTGRYISPDPIGLVGGGNLYAYVENDPVNWIDPMGLYRDIAGGFGATFGIVSLSVTVTTDRCCDENNNERLRTLQIFSGGWELGLGLKGSGGANASLSDNKSTIQKCPKNYDTSGYYSDDSGVWGAFLIGRSYSKNNGTGWKVGFGGGWSIWSGTRIKILNDVIVGKCCQN